MFTSCKGDPPWPSRYDNLIPERGMAGSSRIELDRAGWPGWHINVRQCGGLYILFLKLKDPLEIFGRRMEICSGSGILSRCDMTFDIKSVLNLPMLRLPSSKRKNAVV